MLYILAALAAEARSFDADSPAFVVPGEGSLVLEHTSVRAHVQLGIAVVDVEQSFHNPFDHPIDATYLFPLPPEAAVRAMTMTCGGREIVGEILGREAARERYEQAAAQGFRAALLEQHRPNLFRQSVASLCPGEDVTVSLQYAVQLEVEDGRRELVFPTTVGPRYRPDGVPEPPFTTVPTHMVDVEVLIDEGLGVDSVFSDTHAIEIDELSADGSVVVRNVAGDDLPNKDFELAWTFAGEGHRVGTIAIPPGDEDGYLGITIEPALLEDLQQVQGRELLFVIDESCSMRGTPFQAAADTVRKALAGMRPDDTFNLVRFSSTASSLFAEPRPASAANVAEAEAWLQVFDGGGTEMTAGIVHSLDMPGDPERLRLVLLLTDGYIGDEEQVLATVREHLGDARLFSLGVGPAVNRYLLDALAEEGRGDVAYHLPGTPISETVERFYERIAHPALTDLRIDWGGLQVSEVYPSRLPDLFAGQPVRVVARYRGDVRGREIRLTGNAAGETFELRRTLELEEASHEALPTLWARRKIADLGRTLRADPVGRERQITELAIEHHLVSEYTSLVATEKTPSSCGPAAAGIEVPSMGPDIAENAGVMGAFSPTQGLGGLGTKGMGSGASGYGGGGGNFGAKGEGGLGAVGGDPIILGSLDRTLIDEVIKRQLNSIRYCYQRELQKQPKLGGRVVVKFVIAADGTVSAAEVKSTTLGSSAVESCITGRFLRMQFPETPGGGTVTVSYPFVFSPG